jgi:hypothetical protein
MTASAPPPAVRGRALQRRQGGHVSSHKWRRCGTSNALVTKYSRIPSGSERKMLERMIEGLRVQIGLRENRQRFFK